MNREVWPCFHGKIESRNFVPAPASIYQQAFDSPVSSRLSARGANDFLFPRQTGKQHDTLLMNYKRPPLQSHLGVFLSPS